MELQHDQNDDNNPENCEVDEQSAMERETRAKWESLRDSSAEWAQANGASPSTFDSVIEAQVEHNRAAYQKERVTKELEDSSVIWDKVTPEDCDALRALLDTNPKEPAMHEFLKNNPKFLVQVLGGGHGRFQLSKPRFGSNFIPDFLVAEESSIGIEWYLVEIESPRCKVERSDGLPAQELNHAIGQIRDWREWLTNNLDYARRPKDQHGLGLIGINPNASGLIIIGRRQEYSPRYNEFRRQTRRDSRIAIHSYEWLVDVATSNFSSWLTAELQANQ